MEAEHQGKVGQADELKGYVFCMRAMDPDAGGVEVGDGSGITAVNKIDRDGMRVGSGCQLMCSQNRRVQEGARGAGVDEC